MQFQPFSEAREYVRKLGLKSRDQWREYCKSGSKPRDIPSYPEDVYNSKWVGYGDWLGTGRIAVFDIPEYSYPEFEAISVRIIKKLPQNR